MAKKIAFAVLVEKKAILRKKITQQLGTIGVQEVVGCAAAQSARRSIVATNQSGLLVIGNSIGLENCCSLMSFCRARMAYWTIIVLDHVNSDDSVSNAFSAGADDVLRVPFSDNEFTARLHVRLAQSAGIKEEEGIVSGSAFVDAQLTQTELEIMNFLISHKGKTVTRNELAQHIDDKDWVYGDRKYDVHITNIRKKLKNEPTAKFIVKSVRSIGYYIQESGGELS